MKAKKKSNNERPGTNFYGGNGYVFQGRYKSTLIQDGEAGGRSFRFLELDDRITP